MPTCEYSHYCGRARHSDSGGCEGRPEFNICRRAARRTTVAEGDKPFNEQEFYPEYQNLRENKGGNGKDYRNGLFDPILIDTDRLLEILVLEGWNVIREVNAMGNSPAGWSAIGPQRQELFIGNEEGSQGSISFVMEEGQAIGLNVHAEFVSPTKFNIELEDPLRIVLFNGKPIMVDENYKIIFQDLLNP